MADDDRPGSGGSPAPLPRPRRRRSAAELPRVEGLAALLADIDALRTTLQTDLSLVAAAVEEGADDVAVELVEGDLTSVQDFEHRALAHLQALDAAGTAGPRRTPSPFVGAASTDVGTPAAHEVSGLTATRRRRLLSAAPLAFAAAALVAFAVGLGPAAVSGPSVAGYDDAALASFTLTRLAEQGASTEQLRRAAEALNQDIAALVAAADLDPEAAQQAWLLLQVGNEVLAAQSEQGPLRQVLAESRSLEQQILRMLERMPTPVRPLPSLPVDLPTAPRVLPSQPAYTPPSARPQPSTPPQPEREPAPTPEPAPPAPAPSPTESSPAPSTKPSGNPDPAPSAPFADPFQLSGI